MPGICLRNQTAAGRRPGNQGAAVKGNRRAAGRNGECVARNVRIDRESGAQETLFEWMDWHKAAYPELALAFHIPNGGKRNAAEAAHLKRQGVKAGVPDICLPVARDGYHGLFIELKVGKNKTTPLQEKWLHDLAEQGYKAMVCYGWEEAAGQILRYLGEESGISRKG